MAFEFQIDRPAGENLVRLGRKRLNKAVAALTQTPAPELPGAVHGARKDLKKMRALLRVARPGLKPREFQRENIALRDAGRALSAVRDSQVLAAAFDKLLEAGGDGAKPSQAAIESIRRHLAEDARSVEQAADLARVAPQTAAVLGQVRAQLEDWPLDKAKDDDDGEWPLLGQGLKATYHAGRHAMRRAADPACADEEGFHEWRKQVKRLAYQLQLLRPLWRRVFKALIKELDELAETLGDEHDLSILGVRILEQPVSWTDAADLEAVRNLIVARRKALQRQALALGGLLYVEKPAAFERRLAGYWERRKDER